MSTLSMRLKQRARMLAAGVALSAASLALIPGVAEATDPTDCLCRFVGDIANTEEPDSGGQSGNNADGSGGPGQDNDAGQDNTLLTQDTLDVGNIDAANGNDVQVAGVGDNNTSSAPGGQQGDSTDGPGSPGAAQDNDAG